MLSWKQRESQNIFKIQTPSTISDTAVCRASCRSLIRWVRTGHVHPCIVHPGPGWTPQSWIPAALPNPVPVHHLGLFREPSTLLPVEYYNNLPNHVSGSGSGGSNASSLAVVLDPVIATGGTCAAAIATLREWGAQRIIVLSVLGAASGVKAAAAEWPKGVEIWLAGVDEELTDTGMLKPGLGDVGDRLFLTIGK